MEQLAQEYIKSAALIKERLALLKKNCPNPNRIEHQRINILTAEYGYLITTANYLKRYYDTKEVDGAKDTFI